MKHIRKLGDIVNSYADSLKFWNEHFTNIEGYKVDTKFIDSELVNKIFDDNINENSNVLDFGCGSGWGIFEIYLSKKFKFGLGIDESVNSCRLGNDCAKLSGLEDIIKFKSGNQDLLKDYQDFFDFIISVNVLDVVPDEVTYKIIERLKKSLKHNGKLLICLNPVFTEDEMTSLLKMEKKDGYYYKNGILRCNYKKVEDWEEIFSKDFIIKKSAPFTLTKEEKYERRLYLLEKKK